MKDVEKDVVLKEFKKDLNVKKVIEERIFDHVNLFSDKELTIIKNNSILVKKTYILGLIDGQQIYEYKF